MFVFVLVLVLVLVEQLHPYFWVVVLVGIYGAHLYYRQHPKGCCMFEVSCQGSELQLQLAKTFAKECGTGKGDSIVNIANFYDLHNLGAVLANMIDFQSTLREARLETLLIFDPVNTPVQERDLEAQMPPLMKYMIDTLRGIKLGDRIPACITNVLSATVGDRERAVDSNMNQYLDNGEHFVLASEAELQQISNEYFSSIVN